MSLIQCNKGSTLIEIMVAIMLTSIAIMAVMSMQPVAWGVAGKTDHLGRAAGILKSELERLELSIMDPDNAVVNGTSAYTVYSSGQSSSNQSVDFPYTVTSTIGNINTNSWWITVVVRWPGNATGITGGVVVARQDVFGS